MNIIIPLGSGSRHDNIELRYALRSFEANLPHDRVIIIGQRPEWLQNITHIPFEDKAGFEYRAQNIYNKIRAAFEISSEDVLFCNDDHFILQRIETMPYHHKGLMKGYKTDSYGRMLLNTLAVCPGCYDFDTHCPIVYKRSLFPVLTMPRLGMAVKSSYCAHNGITGEYYPDCKITKPFSFVEIMERIAGRMYFSIGDMAFSGDILKVLQELWPGKSGYEK